MKKYFTEYGHLTLAAIVVALLVAIASPVGNLIKASTTELVSTVGNETNTLVSNFEVDNLNDSRIRLETVLNLNNSGHEYVGTMINGYEKVYVEGPNDLNLKFKLYKMPVGDYNDPYSDYAELKELEAMAYSHTIRTTIYYAEVHYGGLILATVYDASGTYSGDVKIHDVEDYPGIW